MTILNYQLPLPASITSDTRTQPASLRYPEPIETAIVSLTNIIQHQPQLATTYPSRWLAVQLLEGDLNLLDSAPSAEREYVQQQLTELQQHLSGIYGSDLDIAISDARYTHARTILTKAVTMPTTRRVTWADRVDYLTTHRLFGMPIFFGLMYIVFQLVQNVSAPFLDWIDLLFSGPLSRWASALLSALYAPTWLNALVTEGIIGGVGGVLVFLPGLLVMYFALAVLEDSGYLARAAFVMDRAISPLGLHGKSFIPLILGFGCNVPAVYATRTIENRSARLLTMLMIPFMSCSARLPVYVVFGLAFFPYNASLIIWLLYVIGMVVAALVGLVLSRTLFRGASSGMFVLELPPYRRPSWRTVFRQMWQHSAGFVRRAGTTILVVSVGLWLMLHLPWGVTAPRDSYYGQASAAIAPIFAPAGFGTWQASGALITGFAAKEIVVATMAQTYGVDQATETETSQPTFVEDVQTIVVGFGEASLAAGKQLLEVATPGIELFPSSEDQPATALSQALQQHFTPLSAFAFLLFVLLYVPCLTTVGAQIHEFGWRWAGTSIAITLAVPWLVATFVYQIGRYLLG